MRDTRDNPRRGGEGERIDNGWVSSRRTRKSLFLAKRKRKTVALGTGNRVKSGFWADFGVFMRKRAVHSPWPYVCADWIPWRNLCRRWCSETAGFWPVPLGRRGSGDVAADWTAV